MKSQIKKNFVALTLLAILSAPLPSAYAEDPSRGINSDGKPYRVDQEGNEIVDYIAELEVKNEALERQVHGLEYEVEQAQKTVNSLRAGRAETPLVEKNLVKSAPPPEPKVIERVVTKEASCSRDICKELLSNDLEAIRGKYSSRVEELELETKVQENQIRILQAEASNARDRARMLEKGSDSRVVPVKRSAQEVAELEATLENREQQIVTLEQSVDAHTQSINALKAQLNSARSEMDKLGKVSSNGEDLRAQIATLQNRLQQREEELAASQKKVVLLSEQKGQVIRSSSESAPFPVSASEERTLDTGSVARRNAIETLRGRINTRLNTVRSLMVTRDALYAQYKRQKVKVNVTLKPAVSSRGLGIREISGRLRAVTSVVELSALSKDINEIETQVREDVALLERLKRKG